MSGYKDRCFRVFLSFALVMGLLPTQALAEAAEEVSAFADAEPALDVMDDAEPAEDGAPEEEASLEEAAPAVEEETAAEEPAESSDPITYTAAPEDISLNVSDEGPSRQELLDSYLWDRINSYRDGGLSSQARPDGIKLTGSNEVAYNILNTKIAEVAGAYDGGASTEFAIPVSDLTDKQSWTSEDLGCEIVVDGKISANAVNAALASFEPDWDKVYHTLLSENPDQLYWHDKSRVSEVEGEYAISIVRSGAKFSASGSNGEYTLSVKEGSQFVVCLAVAEEYAQSFYYYDGSAVERADGAFMNAQEIVSENAGLEPYDMLVAFKNAICDRVTYDQAAADGNNADMSPWQILNVFDGDSSTNVVCEGYSKAFQFLCDCSELEEQGVYCYSVTGYMDGGTGAGGHMWNIVRMPDGRNYLVDVTNCDDGSIGKPDLLFVAIPTSGSVDDGYTFTCKGSTIHYAYDSDTTNLYDTYELELSSLAYGEGGTDDPDPIDIGTLFYRNQASAPYTGSEQVPAITLFADEDQTTELVLGTDYEVEGYYDDADNKLTGAPVEVGVYTVRLQGIGAYTGTMDVPFVIEATQNFPELVLDEQFEASGEAGGYWVAKFTAPASGRYAFFSEGEYDTFGELFSSTDLSEENRLQYNDDSNDSNFKIVQKLEEGETVYLKVRLYSNEAFTFPVEVSIEIPDLGSVGYDYPDGTYVEYTGSVVEGPSVRFTDDDGNVLVEGVDYEFDHYESGMGVVVAEPIEPGSYTSVFTGINAYTGTQWVGWYIKDFFDISNCYKSCTRDSFVPGEEIDLGLSLRDMRDNELALDTDYRFVGYERDGQAIDGTPSDPGFYKVVYEGIGSYHGTIRIEFSVSDPHGYSVLRQDYDERYDMAPSDTWVGVFTAKDASRYNVTFSADYSATCEVFGDADLTESVGSVSYDSGVGESGTFGFDAESGQSFYFRVTSGEESDGQIRLRVTKAIDLSELSYNVDQTTFYYDGNSHRPSVQVYDSDGFEIVGDRCEFTRFEDAEHNDIGTDAPIEAGSYYIVYMGTNGISGELVIPFRIVYATDVDELVADDQTGLALSGASFICKFTAPEDATYTIYTKGASGVEEMVYADETFQDQIAYCEPWNDTLYENSYVFVYLEEGQTVYVKLVEPGSDGLRGSIRAVRGREIGFCEVNTDQTSFVYDGEQHSPSYTLYNIFDSFELEPDVDFVIDHYENVQTGEQLSDAPSESGIYKEVCRGVGMFGGSCSIRFTIEDVHNLSFASIDYVGHATVMGEPLVLNAKVVDRDGNTLEQGVDYELVYLEESEDVEIDAPSTPGTYRVFARAIGETYRGQTDPVILSVWDAHEFWTANVDLANNIYALTGSEVEPVATVRDGVGNLLTEGIDYQLKGYQTRTIDESDCYAWTYVSENAPSDAGVHRMVFEGLGDYQGTAYGIFTIVEQHELVLDEPASIKLIFGDDYYLSKFTAPADDTYVFYTNRANDNVHVKLYDDAALTNKVADFTSKMGEDDLYDFKYAYEMSAGETVYLLISASEYLSCGLTVSSGIPLGTINAAIGESEFRANGRPVSLDVNFSYSTEEGMVYLVEGVDYELDHYEFVDHSLYDDVEAPSDLGTYYAVYKGLGEYGGFHKIEFTIYNERDLSRGSLTLNKENYVYDGRVVNLDVTVTDCDGNVVDPQGYVLDYYDYSDNKLEDIPSEVGNYVVKARGVAPFTGETSEAYFNIIDPFNLRNTTIAFASKYIAHTGEPVELGMTVTDAAGNPLTEGVDYQISKFMDLEAYEEVDTPVGPGVFEVTIGTLEGSAYSGSKTSSFTIYGNGELVLNEAVDASGNYWQAFWIGYFTAPEAGTYTFYTEGSADTFGWLYPDDTFASGTELDSNDFGGEDNNFALQAELEAGQKVYVKVVESNDGYFTCSVGVKRGKMLSNVIHNYATADMFAYDGEPHVAELEFESEEGLLKEGVDYATPYYLDAEGTRLDEAPTEIGEYEAVYEGTGEYFGTVKASFRIVDNFDVNNCNYFTQQDIYVTTGDPVEVDLHVQNARGERLTLGVDYEVIYYSITEDEDGTEYEELDSAPSEPGEYAVSIRGLDPYYGTGNSKGIIYVRDKYDFSSASIQLEKDTFAYGEAAELVATVHDVDGELLTEGEDYDLIYYHSDEQYTDYTTMPTDKGSYTAIFEGRGDYTGVREAYFSIVDPNNISYGTIELERDVFYVGEELELTPVLTDMLGNVLTEGADYEFWRFCDYESWNSIDKPTSAGLYRVLYKGINGHESSISVPFRIVDLHTLEVDQPQDATFTYDDYSHIWVGEFTAPEAGDYTFYTTGDTVVTGSLYDNDQLKDPLWSVQGYEDDENFSHTTALEDGQTVYLLVKTEYRVKDCAVGVMRGAMLEQVGAVETDQTVFVENGEVQPPLFRLYDSREGKLLDEGVDYELEGYYQSVDGELVEASPVAIGDYVARYRGINAYNGYVDVEYRIVAANDLAAAWINIDPVKVAYTGDPIPAQVSAKDSQDNVLTEGVDFFVEYTDWSDDSFTADAPSEPGTYGVRFVAIEGGACVGESYGTLTYWICDPHSLNDASMSCQDEALYTGDPIVPAHEVYDFEENVLAEGEVYDLKYYDADQQEIAGPPTEVGTYYVQAVAVDGSGYTGSSSYCEFSIVEHYSIDRNVGISIREPDIMLEDGRPCFFHTGSAIEPKVELYANNEGRELVEGEDYTLSYENNADVSDGYAAVAIATGMGTYEGTLEVEFFIVDSVDIDDYLADCGASMDAEGYAHPIYEVPEEGPLYDYTGSPIEFAFTFNGGANKPVQDTDYVLAYEDAEGNPVEPTEIGEYYLVVKSVAGGKLTGTLRIPFQIIDGGNNISKAEVTIPNGSVYNGGAQEPDVTVVFDERELEPGVDYEVKYADNVNAGIATATIIGKGAYVGTTTAQFKIEPADIAGASAVVSSMTFTGEALKPDVVVYVGEIKLVPDEDYGVTYEDNVNAGTGKAIFTGKGNWQGTATAAFTIIPADISVARISAISDRTYNGEVQEPTQQVFIGDVPLTQGVDYEVSYENNVNAGTATYVVTGKGNYAGTALASFKILPAEVTVTAGGASKEYGEPSPELWAEVEGAFGEDEVAYEVTREEGENAGKYDIYVTGEEAQGNYVVTFVNLPNGFTIEPAHIGGIRITRTPIEDQVFDGTAQEPAITLTHKKVTGTEELVAGRDFTVEYANNINAGEATATITGKGNYRESEVLSFNIAQRPVTVIANAASKTFGENDPVLTAKVEGTVKGFDVTYELSRTTGEDADTYDITVTGEASQGNYAVTFEGGTFIIKAKDLSGATIAPIDKQTYMGTSLTPEPEVTLDGVTLVNGEDYELTYADNAAAGTGTVTVSGINNYTGAVSATFEIASGVIDLSGATVTVDAADLVYNGEAQMPSVTVVVGDTTLVEGIDYDVAYANNTNAGTATVTVTGKNMYVGTATASFTIAPKLVIVEANEATKVYGAKDPVFTATVKGTIGTDKVVYTVRRLIEGEDVGLYGIRGVGETLQGNYKVEFVSASFTITKAANGLIATAKKATVSTVYNADKATSSAVNVNVDNADGAVTYANASTHATAKKLSVNKSTGAVTVPKGTDAGTYDVIVKVTAAGDKNHEAGSKDVSFKLTVVKAANGISASATKTTITTTYGAAKAVSAGANVKVTGAVGTLTYANASTNATAKKFTVNKSTGAVTVPKGTAAGTYAVIIKATAAGDDNHKAGNDTASFKVIVNKASIAKATVTAIADQPYSGTAKKPVPTVKLGSSTLKSGTDFTLAYKNNVEVSGNASVTITGKGNYSGTKTVKFRVAFKDVPKSNEFYDKIHLAYDKGLISGYGGEKVGTFGPNDKITRGQICVILWNVAGNPAVKAGKTFSDVKSSAFYYKAVSWASGAGVVNGYSDGTFGPEDNITREQLAVMVANFAKKVGGVSVSGSKADFAKVSDASSVSSYAVGLVGWCYKNKLLVLQGGKLNPKANATRATAAQMAYDLYQLLN